MKYTDIQRLEKINDYCSKLLRYIVNLQNVIPAGYTEHQDMAIALAMCHKLLGDRGAFRVHGGGFAGTVQAFVPNDMLDAFREKMDAALGQGACHVLFIRPYGGVELEVANED